MRINTYWWTRSGSTGPPRCPLRGVPASATFLVHFVKYIIKKGSMHFVRVCVCVCNSLIPSDTPNALPNTRTRCPGSQTQPTITIDDSSTPKNTHFSVSYDTRLIYRHTHKKPQKKLDNLFQLCDMISTPIPTIADEHCSRKLCS